MHTSIIKYFPQKNVPLIWRLIHKNPFQGITVLGVCFVYEVFFVQRLQDEVRRGLFRQSNNNNSNSTSKAVSAVSLARLAERTAVLVVIGATLILVRLKVVMGSTMPFFTNFDNPAAHEPAPAKQLTW
jgi:Na+/melibiose symporter-like transporter